MMRRPRWATRGGTIALAALALTVTACSTGSPTTTTSEPSTDPDSVIPESVLILPGEPTAPIESVALTRHYDQGLASTVYQLVRLDGVDDKPVWRTPPLGSETYRVPLASDGTRVLTAIEDKAYAFDLGNGQPVWEAKLTDIFQPGCDNCFDAIGAHLIVRSYDSVIHGIDTTDGTIDWSHRLENVSGGSRVIGSHLLLFDGVGENAKVSVIDPATGTVILDVPATCTEGDEFGWAQPPTDDSVMLPSSSEPNMAYFGYGLIPACWQKWDLSTATQVWDTLLPDDYLDGDVVTVLDEPTLTFTTRNPSMARLDTTTGAGAAIPLPADMVVTPIANRGSTVIARAVSTRGTPKWSIVGLDATSGAVLWSTPLDEATPVDDFGGSVSSGETDFIDHVEGDHLRLVMVDGDQGLFTQKISIADGTTSGRTPVAFPTDDSSFASLMPVAWRGATAIVIASDHLVVVDTNTSTVTWSY